MGTKNKAGNVQEAPNAQDPITPASKPRKRRSSRLQASSTSPLATTEKLTPAADAAAEGNPSTAPLPRIDLLHDAVEPTPQPTLNEDPLPPPPKEERKEEEVEVSVTQKHRRRRRTTTAVVQDPATITQDVVEEEVEVAEEEETIITATKTKRRRREPDPLPCIDPTPELLASLQTENFTPPPLPVPNLGYACLCMDLRELKPPVFTSRDCIKRTLDAKGLSHLGELTLANCKDLARVIQWNHEHGIRLFRVSSVIQPWMGVHSVRDFPQFGEISKALKFAGDLARVYDQRLTFHPSHFVKLGTADDTLASKSIAELEAHSTIFDLMGYVPSPVNKINIHVGGVYGDKDATLQRWADNYQKLSPNCKARVTVENDDVATSFSLQDLLILHRLCEGNLPLVFDFHHHRFCPGTFTEEEALRAAIATWPQGVRPVVHWSESQRGRKAHAHSDYVKGPIRLPEDLVGAVDVMIESKCKERALLAYRDGLPIPEVEDLGVEDEIEREEAVPAEAEVAFKLM